MKDCIQCVHAEWYRGRLICKLHQCSTPFARDAEGECGPDAMDFKARS